MVTVTLTVSMRYLQKAAELHRRYGLTGLGRRLLERAFASVRTRLYQLRPEVILKTQIAKLPTLKTPARLTISALQARDLAALRLFIRDHNSDASNGLRRLRYSLDHRYSGLIGRLDGRIVGYGWWTDNTAPHPQAQLHALALGERDVFAFDLFIAPSLRGRHTGLEFLAMSQKHLLDLGYAYAYVNIVAANRRSIWVHHQAGWKDYDRRKVRIWCSAIMQCQDRFRRYDPRWF
ncbi:MAG: hypothetical protein HY308_14700 [Gammaproteobacteria bacterium]|nr:hypothetical protein [Gammaproteobacteria bacterium]